MENTSTTRLLTLLNVSATKFGRRKSDISHGPVPKLNRRKSTTDAPESTANVHEKQIEPIIQEDEESATDPYETHFGCTPTCLSEASRKSVDERRWKSTKTTRSKLGHIIELLPEDSSSAGPSQSKKHGILQRLYDPFKERQIKSASKNADLQIDLLQTLSEYPDIYLSSSPWETKRAYRETISLHALNHVSKKRRRIIKNNERLSSVAKTNPDAPPPEDVQDQGFTRPSVLILLPFRNSALDWFNAMAAHTPSSAFQIENQARFVSEYGLPRDAVDKLLAAEPGTYPREHVETFKGNVDDNFRVGIKLTRKSVKMFTEFYGCDIIMASPMGLRQSIQKEKNADYLSSIEMVIVDQMDTLTMQNWDHFNFVLSHLNKLPKESHDTDFSRIKPWYLDGHAQYLRQSILLSTFETPETRSFFNHLKNVSGKIRLEKSWSPIQVPEGIRQDFVHFDCGGPVDEPDKRFHHFTTQILPAILKSAVQSSNTAIFIPSSFDFERVQDHLRKQAGISVAILSEYSSNQQISRARQSFFTGQKSFLLISERFHFFKRYKIRGIRNLVFYGPPDHHQFYAEMLSYPFLDDGVESQDVSCRVLYSKYDWFRLERIAGTQGAVELIKSL